MPQPRKIKMIVRGSGVKIEPKSPNLVVVRVRQTKK